MRLSNLSSQANGCLEPHVTTLLNLCYCTVMTCSHGDGSATIDAGAASFNAPTWRLLVLWRKTARVSLLRRVLSTRSPRFLPSSGLMLYTEYTLRSWSVQREIDRKRACSVTQYRYEIAREGRSLEVYSYLFGTQPVTSVPYTAYTARDM
ncbi:hypothetical protein N657DRAFT_647579 [Parathielavia appendiculata]|uniref:Uncharacterized protein n=1 Tax=Parathielavia appendiculata TaxID=2587402 RepID=A0AAN6TWE9_9PEZI|nr:hypothetical protein N657DRAFT_647579 [Parathielavia appendiculata]